MKREGAQIQQESLALVGRQWGVPWSANTIAQLETGRRHLTVEEWLLLPVIMTQALNPEDDYTYSDFIPQGMKERIALTARTLCYSDGIVALLKRRGALTPQDAEFFDRPRTRRLQAIQSLGAKNPRRQAFADKEGEGDFSQTDYKAARALGVAPNSIIVASMQIWGRLLMEERDNRLAMAKQESLTSRKAQALRGHITRSLLRELRPALREIGEKPMPQKTFGKGVKS